MRQALIITVVALLAVALAAPSSSATTSAASTLGATQTTVVTSTTDCLFPCVTYQVRTANGWGEQKWAYVNNSAGQAAGCDNCKLEAIRAASNIGVGYRIRAQNGWGTWRTWPDPAGCFGCVIQAIQLGQTSNIGAIEYRVWTDGGPGEWRSAITEEVAGCVGCTVHYIQMRVLPIYGP